MTPRGLPCGAGEVRGFIDGRKTQFRRPCKGLGVFVDTELTMGPPTLEPDGAWIWPDGTTLRCPFGGPGDEIYVKETWQHVYETYDGQRFTEKPDRACRHFIEYQATVEDGKHPPRWRSSTTMPRHLSRLTLAVVAVRVERLQDMTPADAMAEGIDLPVPAGAEGSLNFPDGFGGWSEQRREEWIKGTARAIYCARCADADNHVATFAQLWDARHGRGAWERNPWVWAVTVRVPGTAARGGAGR